MSDSASSKRVSVKARGARNVCEKCSTLLSMYKAKALLQPKKKVGRPKGSKTKAAGGDAAEQ